MFAESLSGLGQTSARERRPKVDWAQDVAHLLDTRYVDSERVTFVCDNLNTRAKGAFYEAFEPEQTRNYVRRLEFCSTSKHNYGHTRGLFLQDAGHTSACFINTYRNGTSHVYHTKYRNGP